MNKIPKLDKRITINRRTYASDGMGGQTYTTVTTAVWAEFASITGNESYRFDSSQTNAKFRVTIRYRAVGVVSNKDTITYDSREFRIMYIEQGDFERVYLTLYVIEDNAPS